MIAVIAAADWERCSRDRSSRAVLPDRDLFVKPRSGSGGHRMERWDVVGEARYRNSKGETLSREELVKHLAAMSLKDDYLVQPRLANHPALDDISNGALATVRLLTCRNKQKISRRHRQSFTNFICKL